MHCAALVAPVSFKKVPATHAAHADSPLASEYLPPGHGWQVALLLAPMAVENVPRPHSTHDVASVLDAGAQDPAGHARHSPVVVLKYWPAEHVPYRRMMVPAEPLPPLELLPDPPPEPVLATPFNPTPAPAIHPKPYPPT